MSDPKSFLHQFCQKNKIEQPDFQVRPTGPKHRQRFLCELRLEGYDYVGAGNSTNKKDAQSNAAKDFVSYLVRQGLVNPKDVPAEVDVPAPAPDKKLNNYGLFQTLWRLRHESTSYQRQTFRSVNPFVTVPDERRSYGICHPVNRHACRLECNASERENYQR